MADNPSSLGQSALVQAANALVAAEAALTDADVRLKEAERDRRAALEEIKKRQKQINNAVTELQQGAAASAPPARLEREAPLILQAEDVVHDEAPPVRPRLASVAAEFDRLKAATDAAHDSGDDARSRLGNTK